MLKRMIGTWAILVGASLVLFSTSCSLTQGSIKLEAMIDYKIGGPQPVARTKFYLLNKDLVEISKAARAANDPAKKDALAAVDDLIDESMYASVSTIYFDVDNAKPLIEPYIVQTQETDFKGIATFNGLTPGDYWLIGATETRGGHAYWFHKTTVARGENQVMLSDSNAQYAK